MKKQIFIKAWELFRKYQMTFSQALIEAWKFIKRQVLVEVYNKIPSTKQYSKKKQAAKLLWQSIESIRYEWRITLNNDGAAAYYGIGKYSGD